MLARYALIDRRHSRERAARSFRLDGRQNEAKHHSELFNEGVRKRFAVDSVRKNVAKHIDAGLSCDDSQLFSLKHFAECRVHKWSVRLVTKEITAHRGRIDLV